MILIIAGSRRLAPDPSIIEAALRTVEWWSLVSKVYEGGQEGADLTAKAWAVQKGLPFEQVDADWDNLNVAGARIMYNRQGAYNAAAGPMRNEAMAKRASAEAARLSTACGCLLIWDGQSRGSASMREMATKYGIMVRSYYVPACLLVPASPPKGGSRR
jgi:hypothetical protein